MNAMQCPHCQHLMEPVRVAGHTQCPFCTKVVDECCSGETVHIVEESEPVRRAHATRPDNVGRNWSGDRGSR